MKVAAVIVAALVVGAALGFVPYAVDKQTVTTVERVPACQGARGISDCLAEAYAASQIETGEGGMFRLRCKLHESTTQVQYICALQRPNGDCFGFFAKTLPRTGVPMFEQPSPVSRAVCRPFFR